MVQPFAARFTVPSMDVRSAIMAMELPLSDGDTGIVTMAYQRCCAEGPSLLGANLIRIDPSMSMPVAPLDA